MINQRTTTLIITTVMAGLLSAFASADGLAADPKAIERGAYIFTAAGCEGCHTDTKNNGQLLAGGRALDTPFGTFISPNITADKEHGIGNWTDAEFITALRDGLAPDGSHYFPVFPYPAYTLMRDDDIRDLKAYIFSLPTAATPNKPHEVGFPFNIRMGQMGWKFLFFEPGALQPDPAKSAEINRGEYLVRALGHCGECHTPRNILGGLDRDKLMAGNKVGPEGDPVPNITPHQRTGIGNWTADDLINLLQSGETPLGDEVDGGMAEVVRNSTGKLSGDDLKAIAAYLKSLPPIENQVFQTP